MNELDFEDFLKSLKETNKKLNFFTDFIKCQENVEKISIDLHALNYLLGKKDLKKAIEFLYEKNKECFRVLNILIAVRENVILLNEEKNLIHIDDFFKNSDDIYNFFIQSGLAKIFQNNSITNLHDYVFGIEVGLDSNARKNRSGKIFAKLISGIFKNEHIKFQSEVSSEEFHTLKLGVDKKVFDFVIKGKNTTYLIEANFYNVGGSKLNEVARSYMEISSKISQNKNYQFIWITDGQGWLSAKSKLQEAYKSVEIYNLSNIDTFIEKIKYEL